MGVGAAGSVVIAPTDPRSPAARQCLRAYVDELAAAFDLPVYSHGDDDLVAPAGVLLVASREGEPVGCVGVRFAVPYGGGTAAELKRLWVSPAARGGGLARRLITEAEGHAVASGAHTAVLDTHGALEAAIALYRSAGYREVAPYNDNPYAQRWFAKALQRDDG